MSDAADPVEEHALVMAMPRRELFSLSGFSTRISYPALESIAEESWFAAPGTLSGSLDAKEVRLGLVVTRQDAAGRVEALLGTGGTLVHATPIPPEVAGFGAGLRALRDFAAAAGERFVGARCRVELAGHLNEDGLPEIRDVFLLVYRAVVEAATPAPAECSWCDAVALGREPLDPVGSLVAGALFPG